jgi:anaerobic C4-dicarboxylate transporter
MISASIFFFLLAMNSIFLFTLTDPNKAMTKNKKNRNRIYIWCGIFILASLASLAVLHFVLDPVIIEQDKILLWFEIIMLLAFGVSWLTKGEAIFGD